MKNLTNYIFEKILINKNTNKQIDKDYWDKHDFNDTEVNYYLLSFTHEYDSLAGKQKQDYNHYIIIWNMENLPKDELDNLFEDYINTSNYDGKPDNDAYVVKRSTLKEIYNQMTNKNNTHCWSDVYDYQVKQNVYFVDA